MIFLQLTEVAPHPIAHTAWYVARVYAPPAILAGATNPARYCIEMVVLSTAMSSTLLTGKKSGCGVIRLIV